MGRPGNQSLTQKRSELEMDKGETSLLHTSYVVLYGQKISNSGTRDVIFRSYQPNQRGRNIIFGKHFWQGKAKRQNSYHSRYLKSKYIHSKRTFQNVTIKRSTTCYSAKRLLYFNRPHLGILAHTYRRRISTIPVLQVLKQFLQVSSHAFRSINSPKAIHPDNGQCRKDISETKYTNFDIFRRHTDNRVISNRFTHKKANSVTDTKGLWPNRELEQIGISSDTGNNIPGIDMEFKNNDCTVSRTTNRKDFSKNPIINIRTESKPKGYAIDRRFPGACLLRYKESKTLNKNYIHDLSTKQKEDKNPKDSARGSLLPDNELNQSKTLITKKVAFSTINSFTNDGGRIPERMGGGCYLHNPTPDSSRHMERERQILTNRNIRGESHVSGAISLQLGETAENRNSQRLQTSSRGPEQRGVHKIQSPSGTNITNMEPSSINEIDSDSNLHKRQEKCLSRPTLKKAPMPTRRMGPQPKRLQMDPRTGSQSRNRHLCDRLEQPATKLLHTLQKQQHPVHGRLQRRLEPVESDLCLPSTSHAPQGPRQNPTTQRKDFARFSRMAEQALVSDNTTKSIPNTPNSFPGFVAGSPGLSNPQLTSMLAINIAIFTHSS